MKFSFTQYSTSANMYVLVGILLVSINLLWFVPTIDNMRRQISENELEIVKRGQTEIKSYLQNQILNLTVATSFIKPDLADPSNREAVDKILAFNPYFAKVVLIDRAGRELFRADRVTTSLSDGMTHWTEQPEFTAVLESGAPYFSHVRFTDSLEPLTTLTIPISFVKEEIAAVLLAEVYIRPLFSSLDSIRSASGGHVYLVDKNGILIAHQDPALALRQTDRSKLKIVQDVLFSEKNLAVANDDTYTYVNERSEEALAAGGLIPETGWALIFEESKNMILAPIRKIEVFALVTVVLCLGGVIFLYKINKKVVKAKQAAETAYSQAKRLADEQSVVATLGQQFLGNTNIDLLFNESIESLVQILNVDFVEILELLPDGKHFVFRAGMGWPEGLQSKRQTATETEVSLAQYVLQAKEAVFVSDANSEQRFEVCPYLRELGVVSSLSVMLYGQERPFGILSAHTKTKRTFTQDEIYFFTSVANVLSTSLNRSMNEKILKENLLEVEKMNSMMVNRELKMIELKKQLRELSAQCDSHHSQQPGPPEVSLAESGVK